MANPHHPMSKKIDEMLAAFHPSKFIELELKVDRKVITRRAIYKGYRMTLITDEEKRHLKQRRKEQGLIP